jgi:hypothetical protein
MTEKGLGTKSKKEMKLSELLRDHKNGEQNKY